MWEQVFDEAGFAGKFGLTTAEARHECYNYTWDKAAPKRAYGNGNTWNANSWPYESSRVLMGMANAIRDFDCDSNISEDVDTSYSRGNYNYTAAVNRDRYWQTLLQFAQQHTKSYTVNDTAHPKGSGHIFGRKI